MKNIRFAFALSNDNLFTDEHFIDADHYGIFEYRAENKLLTRVDEMPNKSLLTNSDVERVHQLMEILKENQIDMLVAKSYSTALKKENKHFVPILISGSSPEKVCATIAKNIKWLYDELTIDKEEHMIFKIEKGILKYKL